VASKIARDLRAVPGIVDSHVYQVPDAPAITVDLNRAQALEFGLGQQNVAGNLVTSLNNSLQLSPNFWLDRRNSVSYPLVVQTPTYHIESTQDLWTLPVTAPQANGVLPGTEPQVLMNVAKFGRATVPMVVSQLNIRPVFNVHADVEGRDLNSAAAELDEVIATNKKAAPEGMSITLGGQIETMRESYAGLFSGMALAVVLVFLLLVINFQSWIDPLIVLMAVPFALGGVLWMLFLSQTHISVPADGNAHEHWANHGEQHFGGHVCQSAHGNGYRCSKRRHRGRLHTLAAGPHDRRCDDPRHDSHGVRRRRGR
jgi:multidrug efflux pump subunit AcrB